MNLDKHELDGERHATFQGSDDALTAALERGDLDDVEVLLVQGKKLRSIPLALGRLASLRRLQIDAPNIEHLSEGLTGLTGLERLTVSRLRSVKELPRGWGRMKSLSAVDLELPSVTTIPEDFGELPIRGRLDLWSFDKVTALPDSVGLMSGVTWLRCPPKLTRLPSRIGGMKALEEISATRLEALPDDIGELEKLRILHVNDCRLKALPESLGRCVALEELRAVNNELRALPDLAALQRLRVLALAGNPLDNPPAWLGELRALRILDYRVTGAIDSIPPSLAQLTTLPAADAWGQGLQLPWGAEQAARASGVLDALGPRISFG